MADDGKSLYYPDYLELDKILGAQHPKSFVLTNRSNDEMLFIIVHQAYELWFKLILFELDLALDIFRKPEIQDNSAELLNASKKFARVIKILELLNQQVTVLETMTALDFLEFRSLLSPASGFQSLQFRLIEAKLGLIMAHRHDSAHYKHTGKGGFTQEDLDTLDQTERDDSIKKLLIRWLERIPFFDEAHWTSYTRRYKPTNETSNKFWWDYQNIYEETLDEDDAAKRAEFESVFIVNGSGDFSAPAMRSMLFVMLYREFPLLQAPFEILKMLTEIDELLSMWRYRHLAMVRRMIGLRVGTGGTSGVGYLEGTLSKHYIFKELTEVTTFLVQRSKIPNLPDVVKNRLSFNT